VDGEALMLLDESDLSHLPITEDEAAVLYRGVCVCRKKDAKWNREKASMQQQQKEGYRLQGT
jgi:hypothetical protein